MIETMQRVRVPLDNGQWIEIQAEWNDGMSHRDQRFVRGMLMRARIHLSSRRLPVVQYPARPSPARRYPTTQGG